MEDYFNSIDTPPSSSPSTFNKEGDETDIIDMDTDIDPLDTSI
jgi:hypothetical protein